MPDDEARGEGVERLGAALTARASVQEWSTGAELMALLRAVHGAGWLARLHEATTAEALAAGSGITSARAADALGVLAAAGVVDVLDAGYRLSAPFDALVAGVSGVDVTTALDAQALAVDYAAEAASPSDGRARDRTGVRSLTMARDWGVRPDAGARELYGLVYDAVPEYRDRLAEGGTLLDVGSGVGGALLTTLALFPGLRAVGVELVPEVAEELRSRAVGAGVADRVEVRVMDAGRIEDASAFAVCYWAQAFFPEPGRDDVLAAILRALRPGGLLLMQVTFAPADEQGGDVTRARLDDLVHRRQGIPSGRSAEDLIAEAGAAGLGEPRIVDSPAGRLVVVRRPVDGD